MSTMSRAKSMLKPPLPKSPTRLRPRRAPQSNAVQTPPGSLAKSVKPNRGFEAEGSEVRPEYMTISWELRALASQVQHEFADAEREGPNYPGASVSARAGNPSPLFERGRLYEEYSARRNERLKRKKGHGSGKGEESAAKTGYGLGVKVESAKRGSSSKKMGSVVRKSISGAASGSETPKSRYMLRSMSKENKKPSLPLYSDQSVTRRLRKPQY